MYSRLKLPHDHSVKESLNWRIRRNRSLAGWFRHCRDRQWVHETGQRPCVQQLWGLAGSVLGVDAARCRGRCQPTYVVEEATPANQHSDL
jgi:hypothetical protein